MAASRSAVVAVAFAIAIRSSPARPRLLARAWADCTAFTFTSADAEHLADVAAANDASAVNDPAARAAVLAREIVERWAVELALLPMITASTSAGRPVCCSPGLARSSCHTWHTEPFPPPRPEPTEPEAPHENSGSHEGAATCRTPPTPNWGHHGASFHSEGEDVASPDNRERKGPAGVNCGLESQSASPVPLCKWGFIERRGFTGGSSCGPELKRHPRVWLGDLIRLPDRAAPTQVPTI